MPSLLRTSAMSSASGGFYFLSSSTSIKKLCTVHRPLTPSQSPGPSPRRLTVKCLPNQPVITNPHHPPVLLRILRRRLFSFFATSSSEKSPFPKSRWPHHSRRFFSQGRHRRWCDPHPQCPMRRLFRWNEEMKPGQYQGAPHLLSSVTR